MAKLPTLRDARKTALQSSRRNLMVVKADIEDEKLSAPGLTYGAGPAAAVC